MLAVQGQANRDPDFRVAALADCSTDVLLSVWHHPVPADASPIVLPPSRSSLGTPRSSAPSPAFGTEYLGR